MFVRFFIYFFFFSFRFLSVFVFETIQFLLGEFRGVSFQSKTSVFRLIRLRKRLCLLPTKVIVKMNDIALGVDIRAQIVHTVTPIFIRDKGNVAELRIKRISLSLFFFFLFLTSKYYDCERARNTSVFYIVDDIKKMKWR